MSRSLLPILAAGDTLPDDVNDAPTVKVEIAFNAGYSTPAASRVWTDVSEYVENQDEIGISFGRGDELSTTDANGLSLVLDNSDGRFTAARAASPYYPNVKVGRPVRVSALTATGVTSVRCVGYVDEWPLEWVGTDAYAKARITARSRLARLGLLTKLKSIVEEEILLDSPVAYYTLGEAAGATFASDSSGTGGPRLTQAGTGAAVVFGNATGPGTDGLTAATFAGGKYLKVSLGSFTLAAVECWFSTTYTPASTLVNLIGINDEDLLTIFEGLNVGSQLPGGSSILGDVADGAVHHIAYIPGTGFYLDGVFDTDFATPPVVTTLNIGHAENSPGVNWQGSIAHVVVYATAPSGARFIAHYGAGSDGFAAETPAARLTRYASFAAIPAAEISAETGETTMAHIDTTGNGVVDMMRKVEETEGGVLFDARDGTLTFHDRAHRYGKAASLTLSMADHEVDQDYASKLDRSALINTSTATNAAGTEVATAVNATSVDDYGGHTRDFTLDTNVDEEPFQRAWWTVNKYGEPSARVPRLTIDIAAWPPADQALALAVTIGDRIDVTDIPSQAANATESYFVEGYTETISPGSHRITFNVSPGAVWLDVWQLDSSTHSQLGTTTVLAY